MDVKTNKVGEERVCREFCFLHFLNLLFVCLLPGGDASEDPNGQDAEKGSHAGASVAGPQRTGDDVVALEGDGQDSQYRGVGHRQFHERHQFTFEEKRKCHQIEWCWLVGQTLMKYGGEKGRKCDEDDDVQIDLSVLFKKKKKKKNVETNMTRKVSRNRCQNTR
jgi:hypothetical protein